VVENVPKPVKPRPGWPRELKREQLGLIGSAEASRLA
jgi:hypothetical protein